ncbi:hypothetical protein FMUAM8_45780 [Nocardia cyriacigeorgica]|nr:hypothetical protein FMUAM8_45780 [Nocardia cyriacigeorgica]BDU08229.1 hypothetical protein FMUBM48_44920 [Nocardia cyriacigeorgica]
MPTRTIQPTGACAGCVPSNTLKIAERAVSVRTGGEGAADTGRAYRPGESGSPALGGPDRSRAARPRCVCLSGNQTTPTVEAKAVACRSECG